MNYKTQARLVYGGLLVGILIFMRIVAGWYGVFDRHSPDRALAAEIEREIGLDILFVSYDDEIFENRTLLVHVLVDETIETGKIANSTSQRSPAVYYVYEPRMVNAIKDGKLHPVLFSSGYVYCKGSLDGCIYSGEGFYVGGSSVEEWWYGFEKGSQSWVKSDRNILVILEKLFKPEVAATEQSAEETDREWTLQ